MEISIKNFGPIKSFSTDLEADFFFIVGENNIGKSYAISIIYSILRSLTTNEVLERPVYSGYFIEEAVKKIPPHLKDDFSKEYKSEKAKDVSATEIAKCLTTEFFKDIFLNQFEKSIAATFGDISNLENRRSKEKTIICLKARAIMVDMKISSGKVSVEEMTLRSPVI